MSLIKIAAELFVNKLGGTHGDFDITKVISSLSHLLPTNKGELDVSDLLGQLNGGGLASLVSSWLGDGSNSAISTNQIASLFGENKISEFASSLNLDTSTATQGLADMIPELIDNNSQGGELVDVAKGLLGKLF